MGQMGDDGEAVSQFGSLIVSDFPIYCISHFQQIYRIVQGNNAWGIIDDDDEKQGEGAFDKYL